MTNRIWEISQGFATQFWIDWTVETEKQAWGIESFLHDNEILIWHEYKHTDHIPEDTYAPRNWVLA